MTLETIDFWGEAVGLVTAVKGGYRYFAADQRTRAIDGRLFPTIGHARLAAIRAARAATDLPDATPPSLDDAALAAAARSLDRIPA